MKKMSLKLCFYFGDNDKCTWSKSDFELTKKPIPYLILMGDVCMECLACIWGKKSLLYNGNGLYILDNARYICLLLAEICQKNIQAISPMYIYVSVI